MQALGHDSDELQIEVTQTGQAHARRRGSAALAKRTGDIIELRAIVDEIGADATRFTYSAPAVDTPQTFDLELAASKAMDNPVYYVQMAHARLRSIQARSDEAGITRGALADTDLALLVTNASSRCCASYKSSPTRRARCSGAGTAQGGELDPRIRRGGARLLPRLLRDR